MRSVLVAFIAVASIHPGSGFANPATPSAVDTERNNLVKSLATSCRQFDEDAHWAELDRCNRAWFKQNEEAVWRLHLNPHMIRQDAPPS